MELLTQLAQNGLLALLLAISLSAIAYLFVQYRGAQQQNDMLQEKRISDYKELADKYAHLVEGSKATLDTAISLMQKNKA